MDNTPDLVTILMPAYNGEVYLSQAIESVLAQIYPTWEMIIIDDGSTDNTAKIVAQYADARIRYTYQPNRGQAAALNRGLELARGKYVTTLDTDDWFTPNSLQARVNFLNEHPELGVVYGDGYYCDAAGRPLKRFSEYRIGSINGDVYDVLIATPFFGTGANVMVRREILERHQLRYDESIIWCQDHDIYIRIAEKTHFGVIENVTIWYRIHTANMTRSTPLGRRLESLLRTKCKVLASSRFTIVQPSHKVMFFDYLLIVDLQDQAEEQMAIMQTAQFRELPKQQQTRIMRLVATHYLLKGKQIEFAKECLQKAWVLTPFDTKTSLIGLLAHLHPVVTRHVMQQWRQLQASKAGTHRSPFAMTTETS